MLIEVEIDRAGGRRFHRLLRERLARRFPEAGVALRRVEGAPPLPGAVAALLALERIILRRSRDTLCDPLSAQEFGAPASGAPDIALDLSGYSSERAREALTLRPLYDGAPGEAAMVGALIAGRAPYVAIENALTRQIIVAGHPSLEAADGLTGGMEAVYSRVLTLIEQAIGAPQSSLPRPPYQALAASSLDIARFGIRGQIAQLTRRIYHLCCHAPHWRVGWRSMTGLGSWSWETSRDRNGTCCAIQGIISSPTLSRSPGGARPICSSRISTIASARGSFRSRSSGRTARSAKPFLSSKSPGIFPIPF
jgi:hypothetical protein